jgi:hypothetical protein
MGVKLGLTLREEHRYRVLENWVLRSIFGPKGEGVVGCWRRPLKSYITHTFHQVL